jgi:hypothetical protein
LKIVFTAVGSLVALFILFIVWRYTSVARGARQRDRRILPQLDPIAERLRTGQQVTAGEVEELASTRQNRQLLYEMLTFFKRVDLFPARYLDTVSQGESRLAYWMMHPNELQDPPVDIELVATVHRDVPGGNAAFHVFRYRMATGHWSGEDWLLGLAGPYMAGAEPYLNIAGAFSRAGDREGRVKPTELVDWYIGIILRKAGLEFSPPPREADRGDEQPP